MFVKDHFALEAVVFGAVDLDVVLDMNSRSILFISIIGIITVYLSNSTTTTTDSRIINTTQYKYKYFQVFQLKFLVGVPLLKTSK